MVIRIALVEDQKLFLASLAALLALEDDIEIVGEFTDASEALEKLSELDADVVITDIEMPGLNGIEFAAQLMQARSDLKVILLSAFARDQYVRRVVELGVHGYLLKESPPEVILSAIRNVMSGLTQINSQLLQRRTVPGEALTEQEQAILRLIYSGAANKEIAEDLGLSAGTVRNYVSTIIAKLGAKNRVEACRIAEQRGHIQQPLSSQGACKPE